MLLANNAQGQLVLADRFQKKNGEKCFCPGCQGEVIFKCGPQKIPHFAHRSMQECQHFSEGETAEHLLGKHLLQQALPEDTQLEAYLPELSQRPDLLWRRLAVEFQCSTLSRTRFAERTSNYLAHGYTPWWLVGQQFFPQKHWRQVTSCCLQEAPFGLVLWGVEVAKRKLVLFHSFDWHYQKGLLFETSSQTLQGQLFGEILSLAKVASKPCSWSVSDYQLRIQEKLNRKEKGVLLLQAQSYLHGVNLGALPSWGYAPGCHQALLQEGLLVLRGLYLAGFREFDSWYEKSCQILDWPYFLVNRRRIYQEVFAECVLLAERFGSEETRKF
ncbi:competence protein CoiA [Enterococcus asini]|uniref:competence protein CoiA n=1 Tax=Enterococcus asini TaxID=57732 RepID=UPI0026DA707B|nr:competence protein CoiA family protein [Enterococcus asini]